MADVQPAKPATEPEKIHVERQSSLSQEGTTTDVQLPLGTDTVSQLRQFLETSHLMETQDVFVLPPEGSEKEPPNSVLAKVDEGKVEVKDVEQHPNGEPAVSVLTQGSPMLPNSPASPTSPTSPSSQNFSSLGRASSVASNRSSLYLNTASLTQEAWDAIIARCGILCGIRMDCCAHDTGGPDVAGLCLIDSTESVIHSLYRPKTYTAIEQTTSERQMSYMKAGWMKQALTVKPPYVQASVDASHDHSQSTNKTSTTNFYKAVQTYERVKLTINTTKARRAVSEDFLEDIREALNDLYDKRLALKNVFEKWGHVLATEVVLGAERQLFTQATNVTERTETHIKSQLETKLQTAIPQSPLEETTSAGLTKDETDTFKYALNRVGSCFVGGRSEFHGERYLGEWRQSIESFEFWDVIRRVKVIPTVELLPVELQQEIMITVNKPLLGRWLYKSQIDDIKCRHHHVYQAKLTKHDSKDGWFTLGQTLDDSRVLVVKESDDGRGALTPVLDSLDRVIWHKHHPRHSDNFCSLTPQSSGHAPLGSFFFSSYHNGYGPIEGHGKTKHICAVRTDLLAPAQYKEHSVWQDDRMLKSERKKGSVWSIVPVTIDGQPTTFDLQMFQVVEGTERPTGTVMGLRRDCVEILDSYGAQ